MRQLHLETQSTGRRGEDGMREEKEAEHRLEFGCPRKGGWGHLSHGLHNLVVVVLLNSLNPGNSSPPSFLARLLKGIGAPARYRPAGVATLASEVGSDG